MPKRVTRSDVLPSPGGLPIPGWFVLVLTVAHPGTASADNLVSNGHFASAGEDWTQTVVQSSWGGAPLFEYFTSDGCLPDRAHWLAINAWAGADGYVEQEITLPCGVASTLSLWTWGNKDPTQATISIIDQSGAEHVLESYVPPPIHAEPTPGTVVCSGNSPIHKEFDLSAFGGQQVKLRLRGTSSGMSGTMADFDDVTIVADGQVSIEFITGPAIMEISQHGGPKEVSVDPPIATRFGRTYLPFRARLTSEGGDGISGCELSVAIEGDATKLGISSDTQGSGLAQMKLTAEADGKTPQVYLVSQKLYAEEGLASVGVTVASGMARESKTWEVVDNLEELQKVYESRIPTGA